MSGKRIVLYAVLLAIAIMVVMSIPAEVIMMGFMTPVSPLTDAITCFCFVAIAVACYKAFPLFD